MRRLIDYTDTHIDCESWLEYNDEFVILEKTDSGKFVARFLNAFYNTECENFVKFKEEAETKEEAVRKLFKNNSGKKYLRIEGGSFSHKKQCVFPIFDTSNLNI